MFLLAPWLAWIAAVTSGVLLVALWSEFGTPTRIIAAACFVVGIYGQFFSESAVLGATGLGLQTSLAVYLVIRWKLDQTASH